MSQPVRILHAVRIMNRAGIETWLMHLLRHFDRREVAMDFLVQTNCAGAYDEEIRSLGARIFPCLSPSRPWRYVREMHRVLREYGPFDVVHSHNYFYSGLDLRVAAQAGVPRRIAHIHPYRDLKERRPFRSLYRAWMGRWIRRHATSVLAPSHASWEAFRQYAGANAGFTVIRNCVEIGDYRASMDRPATRRRFGLPRDLPVIVYVARYEPHKNHAFLFRVAESVNAHFVFAGSDGSTRRALEAQCAGRSNFTLLVDPPEIAPLLRSADLFLFPSTEEGFGTVAIEAAAAGLPVVASDLPAIREACAPGHRAYMFAPGDDAAAARHLRAILGAPALARQLGGEAVRWAAQFTVESVAEQLAEIYGARQAVVLS